MSLLSLPHAEYQMFAAEAVSLMVKFNWTGDVALYCLHHVREVVDNDLVLATMYYSKNRTLDF